MTCTDTLRTLLIQIRSILMELTTPSFDLDKINLLISVLKTSPFYFNTSRIVLCISDELDILNTVIIYISTLPTHLTCNTSNSTGPHIAIRRIAFSVSLLVRVSLCRKLCSSGASDAGRANVERHASLVRTTVENNWTSLTSSAIKAVEILSSMIDPPPTHSNSLWDAITSLFTPPPACELTN
jgi:hypothetical protein